MAQEPVKLFELSGPDFLKGISQQPTLQYGGIFQTASNFDPFNTLGMVTPSPAGTEKGSAQIGQNVRYAVGFTSGNVPHTYFYGGSGSTGALYDYDSSDNSVTDVSANITTTDATARGAIEYKGYFVYARGTSTQSTHSIRSRIIPVSSGSDAEILANSANAVVTDHPFTLGADLNLYFPNGNKVGKIVDPTTTSAANSWNVFALESGMFIRQLINDGRYLVIIADNNSEALNSATTKGTYRAVIAFWDYTSGSLAQRFDFTETFLIGGAIVDGNVYVFGYDNIYVCNVATFPKPIHSFRGTSSISSPPTSHRSIAVRGNSVLWGALNGQVYGYGSQVATQDKIFYNPTTTPSGTTVHSLFNIGNAIWIGTDDTKLYDMSGGSVGSTTLSLAHVDFGTPVKYGFAKVVTRAPLSSGQAVNLTINAANGNYNVANNVAFGFDVYGAKQTNIYEQSAASTVKDYFEELSNVSLSITGCGLVRFELWGYPQQPRQALI